MAAPFPEAQLEALIWSILLILTVSVGALAYYVRKLHAELRNGENVNEELRVDNIGLSKKSQDLLEEVMEESRLQSEIPSELKVSKATVSNAVSELKERGLIIRKKRANTYLIEADTEELEKQQR